MENLTHLPYADEVLISYMEIDFGEDKLRLVFKSSNSQDRYNQRSLKTIAEIRHVNGMKYKHTAFEDYRKILQTVPLNYQNIKTVTKFHNAAIEHHIKSVVNDVNKLYNVCFNL